MVTRQGWPVLDTKSEAWGFACRAILAIGTAFSFAIARAGILGGQSPADLILLRFGVAGLVLLPVLLRGGVTTLAGIGWKRGLALLLLGGPLFAGLQTGGYAFAPLAHGAVIAPATVTIVSTLLAATVLGERPGRAHFVGAALVLAGIVLISLHGLLAPEGGRSWVGDLMFFTSSLLWAGFTVMVRLWRLDAIRAVAVVAVLSLLVVVPSYAVVVGLAHLASLPVGPLVLQAVVQGGLQGVIAIIAYSHAVRVLGVSRTVLFPAIVPAVSVPLGIPIVGEIPSPVQVAGLVLVTFGLLAAVGVFRRRRA